jgi:tetratricopeptide (TPR) repeat protein
MKWIHRRRNKSKFILRFIYLLLVANFLYSCDFSPQLHKDVVVAQGYIQNHDYQNAINKYEMILKLGPPKNVLIKIYFQLAELYLIYQEDYTKTLNCYEQILSLTSELHWKVKSEEKKGDIYLSYLNDYEGAKTSYGKLLKMNPFLASKDFYEYRYALAHLKLNDFTKAKELYFKILERPGHAYKMDSLNDLGLLNYLDKKWADSISYWVEYLKLEKREDKVVYTKFLMANSFETLDDLEKAYGIYYSIIDHFPHPEVLKKRLSAILIRRSGKI